MTISLVVFKDNGRSVPLVFLQFLHTRIAYCGACATLKGSAESSANLLLREESADGLG